jgi:hypothetical protein
MSLFEWISSKDSAYSLDSLSQHVLDHLEKTDDRDLREALAFFAMVQDVSKKSQYRDIGGIDKRLATLNAKLQQLEGLSHCRPVSWPSTSPCRMPGQGPGGDQPRRAADHAGQHAERGHLAETAVGRLAPPIEGSAQLRAQLHQLQGRSRQEQSVFFDFMGLKNGRVLT